MPYPGAYSCYKKIDRDLSHSPRNNLELNILVQRISLHSKEPGPRFSYLLSFQTGTKRNASNSHGPPHGNPFPYICSKSLCCGEEKSLKLLKSLITLNCRPSQIFLIGLVELEQRRLRHYLQTKDVQP